MVPVPDRALSASPRRRIQMSAWNTPIVRLLARTESVLLRQFVKFCVVGALNTAVTIVVIFTLMRALQVNYLISNMVGYVLGLVNSFFWNKRWTFRSSGPVARESAAFLMVFLASYLVQLGGLVLLKETLYVGVDIAQILSMVLFSLVNFLGNKYISFARVDRQESQKHLEGV